MKTNENYEVAVNDGLGKEGYVWRRAQIASAARLFLQQHGVNAQRELVRTTTKLDRLSGEVRP